MRRRDVALGDGDEAGEPRLRREQIVTTRVEAVIGNAVADREELPRRVEEKAELHRVEHRLRELGEGRKAADQRSGGCGRTRETLDERIDSVRASLCAAPSVAKRVRRVVSSCMAVSQCSGVSARVGSETKKARIAVQPNACSGVGAPCERVFPKIKPRPGKRHVKITRVTRDARVARPPPRRAPLHRRGHLVPRSACAQCPPGYERGPQVQ